MDAFPSFNFSLNGINRPIKSVVFPGRIPKLEQRLTTTPRFSPEFLLPGRVPKSPSVFPTPKTPPTALPERFIPGKIPKIPEVPLMNTTTPEFAHRFIIGRTLIAPELTIHTAAPAIFPGRIPKVPTPPSITTTTPRGAPGILLGRIPIFQTPPIVTTTTHRSEPGVISGRIPMNPEKPATPPAVPGAVLPSRIRKVSTTIPITTTTPQTAPGIFPGRISKVSTPTTTTTLRPAPPPIPGRIPNETNVIPLPSQEGVNLTTSASYTYDSGQVVETTTLNALSSPASTLNPNVLSLLPEYPVVNDTNIISNVSMTVQSHLNHGGGRELTLDNSRICGFPGFCDNSAYDACTNTAINSCDKCSSSNAALFLAFVIILGLLVLIGNMLVVCVGIRRRYKGKYNKLDICRISLAVADSFTGFLLFTVTVPNFYWTTSLTSLELDAQQLASYGSLKALFGSVFYMLGYTAPIYHLLYIGSQRIYAIAKPIQYKWQSKRSVYIGLVVVWAFSLASATFHVWFPRYLTYSYNVLSFLYLPDVGQGSLEQDYTAIIVVLAIFFLLPYVLMTISTIACAIFIVRNFIDNNRKFSEGNSTKEGMLSRRKVRVFFTIAIMQLGFTVTLLPVLIVVILFYSGSLSCTDASKPYLICMYISMSNSLVNVIIYNIRDESFRTSVKELFASCFSYVKYPKSSSVSQPSSGRNSGGKCELSNLNQPGKPEFYAKSTSTPLTSVAEKAALNA